MSAPSPLWKRLSRMAAIWTASILALGAVTGPLRWWLVG